MEISIKLTYTQYLDGIYIIIIITKIKNTCNIYKACMFNNLKICLIISLIIYNKYIQLKIHIV